MAVRVPNRAAVAGARVEITFPVHRTVNVSAISGLACLALILSGHFSTLALAQTPASDLALETVVVKGQALSSSPNQPYSTSQFSREELRERQIAQPEQLFREVPGMEVRSLGYGGVANSITLRGFSGGGHGGDIGFVLDGIPLNEASSHADGYADLNVVVPLELRAVNISRGPVSALYGNFNRAGVVALESRKGGKYLETDLRYGSFNTIDLQAALGTESGPVAVNAAVQGYASDGFRPQSANHRATLAGRVAIDISAATQLAVSSRLHSARADTASVITQAQYDNAATFHTKNENVQNDGTDKSFFTLRGDLSHTLSPGLRALVFAYSTQQTFTRYFTRLTNATTWQQRSEDYVRDVSGYGANLNGKHMLIGKRLQWVAGVEAYNEETRFKYADALDKRNFTATTTTAGIAGGVGTLDRRLTTRSVSLFAQAEWAFDPLLRPAIGLRHDRLTGSCQRQGTETRSGSTAQCGTMPAFSILTPKLGVRSSWVPGRVEARASVADGFALPSDAAKFTDGIGVQPTRFRQNELGLTLTPGASWLIDLAAFRIDSHDEVALVNAATLTYANIGKTRRTGIEAEIRYSPISWLEGSAALSRTRTEVRESLTTTPYLVGAEMTGVPQTLATLTATVRPWAAYAFTGIVRSVGRYAIRQPVSATSGVMHYNGYSVLDLMASYEPSGSAGRRERYHIQIANLTDRRYATSSGVTSGVQTYNPAAPRTVTVGASLDF